MTHTDDSIAQDLKAFGLDISGTAEEKRERLALYFAVHGHYVDAWEVRTGRPWNQMSAAEAWELVDRYPELINNPGIRSRLRSTP